LRWLFGSVLTGIFSAALVGGALQAAVGLNGYLIVRPALANTAPHGDTGAFAEKGDRFRPAAEAEATRRVIQISTVTRSEDRDVVRVRPFAHVRTSWQPGRLRHCGAHTGVQPARHLFRQSRRTADRDRSERFDLRRRG
jgi:hypothetical protein